MLLAKLPIWVDFPLQAHVPVGVQVRRGDVVFEGSVLHLFTLYDPLMNRGVDATVDPVDYERDLKPMLETLYAS